jgi:hypothetical protein
MTKPLIAILGSAALAACGGGGGGGGGGPSGPVAGTVGGAAFTPAEGGALVVAPTTCTVTGLGTVNVSGLMIGFSSFMGLCGYAQAAHFCDNKASATIIGLQIMKAGLVQTPGAVGPGTYPISTTAPVPDASGNFGVNGGNITVTGAACALVSNPDASSGSITISAVSASRVQGSLSVGFGTGNAIAGAFDLPLCAYTPDICALLNDTTCGGGSPGCIP